MVGAIDRARRLAEGVRRHGQQERPHPVGGNDARRRLRPQPRECQAAGQAICPASRYCPVRRRLYDLKCAAIATTDQLPQSDSFHPRRALEDAFDRSDRQLVNSINRTRRQSCPTTSREWSLAERFVSGSAPAGATRPFVDVQSVLCRHCRFAVPSTQDRSESPGSMPKTNADLDRRKSPCRAV